MLNTYFAGFFDGEGCIRIDRIRITSRPTHYTRYQLKVSAAQINPKPLYMIQEQFGGAIGYQTKKSSTKHRATFQWYAWSKYACDFLVALRPYLIVKAEEADLAIEFYRKMKSLDSHFRRHRGNPPDKDAILAEREIVVAELNGLKRKVYEGPSVAALSSS